MNIKEYNVEDLFIHYLFRLSGNYPYIKLISDDTSTTINLGYEQCDDEENAISNQAFVPLGKYPITVNLKELKPFFEKTHSTLISLSNDEILIETKATVEQCWCIDDDIPNLRFSKELLKHLETHKRSILNLSKERFLRSTTPYNVSIMEDPIPIGPYSLTEAVIVLSCDPSYIGCGEIGAKSQLVGPCFVTSLYEIQHLDSSKFGVFVLKEGRNTITFEIINNVL